jgi:hypothetical protein
VFGRSFSVIQVRNGCITVQSGPRERREQTSENIEVTRDGHRDYRDCIYSRTVETIETIETAETGAAKTIEITEGATHRAREHTEQTIRGYRSRLRLSIEAIEIPLSLPRP